MDLERFGVGNPGLFARRLDQATKRLIARLPTRAQKWGVARKALNLFLRDAFYSTYLRKRFKLARAEASYEIPLDQIVTGRIQPLSGANLPAWSGVKHLTPAVSAKYQSAAAAQASDLGMARVHLDIYLWSDRTN
jgi:hypothetical protein